jgi:hydrogenase-4 component F
MFHAVNHSLTKGALFLVAGNILARYRTKSVNEVSGLLQSMPGNGLLWVAGILAITGAPPFGLFTSELMILKGAVADGRWVTAGLFLAALAIAFAAMMWTLLRMSWGSPVKPDQLQEATTKSVFSTTVPAVLLAGVLLLGLWIPNPLWNVIESAARIIAGGL